MTQQSELFNLVLALISVLFLVGFRVARVPLHGRFVMGFSALLCSYVFTVLEGYLLPDLFNFLEHLCQAVASLLFCAAILPLTRDQIDRSRETPK